MVYTCSTRPQLIGGLDCNHFDRRSSFKSLSLPIVDHPLNRDHTRFSTILVVDHHSRSLSHLIAGRISNLDHLVCSRSWYTDNRSWCCDILHCAAWHPTILLNDLSYVGIAQTSYHFRYLQFALQKLALNVMDGYVARQGISEWLLREVSCTIKGLYRCMHPIYARQLVNYVIYYAVYASLCVPIMNWRSWLEIRSICQSVLCR